MKLQLKQFDITMNQYHNPFYDLLNGTEEERNRFEEDAYKRINKRMHQIDCLKKLRNNNLSDNELYYLVNEVYYLSYENRYVLNTNILTDYDLTVIVRVNSEKELDTRKFYDMSEIEEMFDNEEVLLEGTNIVEYDYEYYKKIYGVERKDFKHIDDDEIGKYYSVFRNKEIKNDKIINSVKETLTSEKIDKDLMFLIGLTDTELTYLKNLDQHIKVDSLTY